MKSRPALLAVALAATVLAAPSGAAEPASTVRAPHYGDTLFTFFQGKYFSAITGLMTSQHFERLDTHEDDAEILRGGLLLSYGLHREAGEIFAKLIEKNARPAVRDRAWFYLAKIRYQRGFLAEAEAAVNRIENSLPPDLEEERGLLHSNLLLAREDYAGAVTLLQALKPGPKSSLYIRYNLGVALVKSGDTAAGNQWLDQVGTATPLADEEARTLRDRANVALGFAALAENRPEDARKALERVRLEGLNSNKALLGFGWAAAALKDAKLALVPWTELAARDAGDASVLEARIAVPYAYAELGAYGQSLARYQEAIATFEKEDRNLDESIAAIRAGKLLNGLIERNPGEEMGWFWNIESLPEMPHASHLTQVLAQHEFQEAFKNWRDLQFLGTNLQGWQDNLGVYGDMLDTRRRAYADRLPKVLGSAGGIDLDAARKKRDALAAELQKAESEADASVFPSAREQALLARMEAVEEALKPLAKDPEFAAARDRLRLARGALTWQMGQEFPGRLWEAKKAMRVVDRELASAAQHQANLAAAQKDEPAKFDAFARRIAALDGQVRGLIPRVAALGKEQQEAVQAVAVAELVKQKERLAVYATQARFAVAQLYDRAKKVDGDANPPR